MRRVLSCFLLVLFSTQLAFAGSREHESSRYDILLEAQRARLSAAERNFPLYMTAGWFASLGFVLSIGALVAGPILWYRGHVDDDTSVRNAGMITTGVSGLVTLPASVRMSMFAQSGVRQSAVDQLRFPLIIAATEQAIIAREYGFPVMIREFIVLEGSGVSNASSTSNVTQSLPVRMHLENVGDELLEQIVLRIEITHHDAPENSTTVVSVVVPESLEPGARFWESMLVPLDSHDGLGPQQYSARIVGIEAHTEDGLRLQEDDPTVIHDILTVGAVQ